MYAALPALLLMGAGARREFDHAEGTVQVGGNSGAKNLKIAVAWKASVESLQTLHFSASMPDVDEARLRLTIRRPEGGELMIESSKDRIDGRDRARGTLRLDCSQGDRCESTVPVRVEVLGSKLVQPIAVAWYASGTIQYTAQPSCMGVRTHSDFVDVDVGATP